MSALINALKLVPKNAVSRGFGAFLRVPWPRPVVSAGIRGFAKAYDVPLDEAEKEVGAYRSFNDFFTRRLKPGLRPVNAGEEWAVCPVDGRVGQAAPIDGRTMVQAKGRLFTLDELLVDPADAADYEGGTFATLYLAPYNYHRIHVPLGGRITGYSYVPGHLWPVNTKGVAEIDKLFAVNERLITHLETPAGKVAVVKVGATCVGRIRTTYDDVVTNNGGPAEFKRHRYEPGYDVARADECGIFEMGSTVIVLFQRGRAELHPEIKPDAVIRLGQPLARWKPAV